MLQVLTSHNTFGDYLFCHAKHKLFNNSTRKTLLQYFVLEERNIILQNLTPKRLAVTLNLRVFSNQSGSCSDLFEKLLKSKTAIKERRHCIFRKYKIIRLHVALTTLLYLHGGGWKTSTTVHGTISMDSRKKKWKKCPIRSDILPYNK